MDVRYCGRKILDNLGQYLWNFQCEIRKKNLLNKISLITFISNQGAIGNRVKILRFRKKHTLETW